MISQICSLIGLVGAQVLSTSTEGAPEAGPLSKVLGGLLGTPTGIGQGVFAASLWERIQNREHATQGDDEDLTRIASKACAQIVAGHGERQGLRDPKVLGALQSLSDLARERFAAIESMPGIAHLQPSDLGELPATLRGEILRGGQTSGPAPISEAAWSAILNYLTSRKAASGWKLPERVLKSLAQDLEARFLDQVRLVLRQDWSSGGRSYAGLHLALMGHMIETARELPSDAQSALHADDLQSLLAAATHSSQALIDSLADQERQRHGSLIRRIDQGSRQLEGVEARIVREVRAAGRPAPTGPLQLFPPADPTFSGRDESIEALHKALAQHDRVVLQGLPGVGKTELAVHYAHRHAGDYDDVLWVSAESPETLQRDFAVIASALGVVGEPGQDLRGPVLGALAMRENWLLLVDNLDEPEIARTLLAHTSGGKLLLTSRRQLTEDWGQPVQLEPFSSAVAARVLLHLGGREDPSPQETAAAEELAREVAGLALSLRHLGALLRRTSISLQELLDLYRSAGAELRARGDSNTLRQHESVAVTFSLALQGISSSAARDALSLLSQLSPEPVPCELIQKGKGLAGTDLEAAQADALAWLDLQEELQASGLVQFDRQRNTLRVHRLVLDVARDLLDAEQADAWLARALELVDDGFPEWDYESAELCAALFPHALTLIQRGEAAGMATKEVGGLLYTCGCYSQDIATFELAEDLLKRALILYEQICASSDPRLGDAYNQLGRLYYMLGENPSALEFIERAEGVYRQAYASDHKKVATSVNNRGMTLFALDRGTEGLNLVREALALREANPEVSAVDRANSHDNLAVLLAGMGKPGEALPHYEKAHEILLGAYGPGHPGIARSLTQLACGLHDNGQTEQALASCEEALAILEGLHAPGPVDPAATMSATFKADRDADGLASTEAEGSIRQIDLSRRHFGLRHPTAALTLRTLASLQGSAGTDRAIELQERALAIFEDCYGPDHLSVAETLDALASLNFDSGRRARAIDLARRCLDIRQRALGLDHRLVADSLNQLGHYYQQRQDPAGALELAREALALRRKLLGEEHEATAVAYHNLAYALDSLFRHEEALPLMLEAVAIRKRVNGPGHSSVARSLDGLSNIYEGLERFPEALGALEESLALHSANGTPPDMATSYSLSALGRLYRTLDRNQEALGAYRRAHAVAEDLIGGDQPEAGLVLWEVARELQTLGKTREADQTMRAALAASLHPPKLPISIVAMDALAELHMENGQAVDGFRFRQEALRNRQEVLGQDHEDLVWRLTELTQTAVSLQELDQALTFAQDALRIATAQGLDVETRTYALIHLSSVQCLQGLDSEAMASADQALALAEEHRSQAPHLVGQCESHQAEVRGKLSDPEGAVAALERSQAEAARAGVRFQWSDALLEVLDHGAASKGPRWVLERINADLERLDAGGSDDLPRDVGILLAAATCLLDTGRKASGRKRADQAVALAEGSVDGDPVVLARALAMGAQARSMQGDIDDATVFMERCLSLLPSNPGEPELELFPLHAGAALLYSRQYRFHDSTQAYESALAIWDGVGAGDRQPLGDVLLEYGRLLVRHFRLADAEHALVRAQAILEQATGAHSPQAWSCRMSLATIQRLKHDFDKAQAMLDELHSEALAARPKDADQIAGSLHALGNLARDQGRFADSMAYFKEASSHMGLMRNRATLHMNMGWTLLLDGQLEPARRMLNKTLKKVNHPKHSNPLVHALASGLQAQCLAALGQDAQALEMGTQALAELRSMMGPKPPRVQTLEACLDALD